MPEGGHNFEKQEVSPVQEVDFESILEKGEIEKVTELRGYWGMRFVEIKDDGDALFRPDSESYFLFEDKGMEARRSDLELIAYKIDKILGFNLVPEVVNRMIEDREGSLQRLIKVVPHPFGNELQPVLNSHVKSVLDNYVNSEEIKRAAIFDFLLDVKDRHTGNFVIESDTRKLWLIDHDFYMFYWEIPRTLLVDNAIEMGLTVLDESERSSVEKFLAHADSLTVGAKREVVEIIKKAVDRAKILLEQGQIPATNT
jgi:hypothetical protein